MLWGFQFVALPISSMLAPLPRLSSAMTLEDLVVVFDIAIFWVSCAGAGPSGAPTDQSRGSLNGGRRVVIIVATQIAMLD